VPIAQALCETAPISARVRPGDEEKVVPVRVGLGDENWRHQGI